MKIMPIACKGVECYSSDGQKCVFLDDITWKSCQNIDINCDGIIWIQKKSNGGLPMKSVKQIQNAIFAKETKIGKLTRDLNSEKEMVKCLKIELKEAKKKK